MVDDLLGAKASIGDPMMGAVLNSVLHYRMAYARDKVTPFLAARGVPVFAALPKEKVLLSVSVRACSKGWGASPFAARTPLTSWSKISW